jgi:putative membrane protein
MSTRHLLISAWDWEPSVVVGCALLLLVYSGFVRPRNAKQTVFFVAGVLVMLFALVSPIDTLGDTYLFSVHMLQHLLLVLIVPPLLILGISKKSTEQLLHWELASRAETALSRPALAWSLAIVIMSAWHIPALYNAALANENIHIAQHLMFLVTATIFWWPVLAPVPKLRMGTGSTVIYLFAAAASNTVLGIVITFAPVGIYPAYIAPHDALSILPLIRQSWGISAAADQQIGGLLMWVPGCSIYFIGILIALIHWYSQPEIEPIELREAEADAASAAYKWEAKGSNVAR